MPFGFCDIQLLELYVTAAPFKRMESSLQVTLSLVSRISICNLDLSRGNFLSNCIRSVITNKFLIYLYCQEQTVGKFPYRLNVFSLSDWCFRLISK